MWNVIITFSTVGYGDFYARTVLGRTVIFFVTILGLFVVSMLTVSLFNSLVISSLESKALTVMEKIQVKE